MLVYHSAAFSDHSPSCLDSASDNNSQFRKRNLSATKEIPQGALSMESNSSTCTADRDSVIVLMKGSNEEDSEEPGVVQKRTKNRRTQLALSGSSSSTGDFDDIFAEHCLTCRSKFGSSGFCEKCSPFDALPARAATPRGPLQKSTDSFYSSKCQKPNRTYGEYQGSCMSKILEDSKSTPTKRGKGRKKRLKTLQASPPVLQCKTRLNAYMQVKF